MTVDRLAAGGTVRRLSPTQLKILQLAAQGLTRTQIAAHTGYARGTIANYLTATHQRLYARNTAHAVAIGYTAGLLETPCEARLRAELAATQQELADLKAAVVATQVASWKGSSIEVAS